MPTKLNNLKLTNRVEIEENEWHFLFNGLPLRKFGQSMKIDKKTIENSFRSLQDGICTALSKSDGIGVFKEDLWDRSGGGGGRTRIIQDGAVIEKGGVNFSAVHGQLPENISNALQVEDKEFYATGVSIVIHPKNPMVPIIHMNIRYFEISESTWWFGGGIDLTPHYIVDKDARYFHQELKQVCDQHEANYYNRFKEWADNYFYNQHRKETRGIGGIFFDRLGNNEQLSKEQLFDFVMGVGNAFAPIYTHFMNSNRDLAFGDKELLWQNIRRGRYVEFNLVYDKGTKFGLETNGRIESILMSLPKNAGWEYNFEVEPNSAEATTLSKLVKGKNWV